MLASTQQVFLFVFLLMYVGVSMAAHPFATDDAGTVAKGTSEIELGSSFYSSGRELGYSLVHGLTEQLDLSAGSGHCFAPEGEKTVHPVSLGLKMAVIPGKLSLTLSAPLAQYEHSLTAVFSHAYNEHVNSNVNVGYEAAEELSSVRFVFASSLIFVADKLDGGAEFSGNSNGINWLQLGFGYTFAGFARASAGLGLEGKRLDKPNLMLGMTFFMSELKGIGNVEK